MSSIRVSSVVSADPGAAWASLTDPTKAALSAPAEFVRAIARATNERLIGPFQSTLHSIDDQHRRIDTAADELHKELTTAVEPVRAWLLGRTSTQCQVDHDPPPFAGCSFNPSATLQRYFAGGKSDIDLANVVKEWNEYLSIPRDARYQVLDGNIGAGWGVAGVAVFLLLLAMAFSNGIGFFKTVYIVAITAGLAAIFMNTTAKSEHRQRIESAFARAQQLTAEASVKIAETKRHGESHIEAERAAAHLQLARQEEQCRLSYARGVQEAKRAFARARAAAGLFGVSTESPTWASWEPVNATLNFVRIGELIAPTDKLDQRLRPPSPLSRLPALLPFAPGRGLSFEGPSAGKARRVGTVQSIALRLIASIPPGKVRFTFIDPVGLGQNVAPLLSLGDHVAELIGGRAWSEPTHIEQRLAELTQHMETIIQKYLRDEHLTIESYNANAGRITEPYHIVVVCDFPTNFTETAARRLISIAQNGPRCGVYALIIVDADRRMPYGISLAPLAAHLTSIRDADGASSWCDSDFQSWILQPDDAPPSAAVQRVTRKHAELAEGGMRVSLPFGDLVDHAGLDALSWREKSHSSADDISVPLGQSGVRKYQTLRFGKGTAHHALVVGQTGSGKSNLLHVLITMLALKYAPDELELYLVDFKQGVEFKLYAEAALPHARVIAIQTEREFGLSVLRGLLAEMDRRGDLFRASGVPSLTDWRRRGDQKLPRILLLVDEFRVFFAADDTIATEATMAIDRLVSQGRAFGIHVVLASQTLAGSYSLPRSITDQMAVRIVLQCTETDSRLALADDNPDARLLSRPGEAIYNDHRGLIEGNNRFQVADMGDDERRAAILREHLAPRMAAAGLSKRPIVFEGHRPARLEESAPLAAALNRGTWPERARSVDVWLGEPLALRPPTAVRFRRQGAANLLLVMRDEEQAVDLAQVTMLTLAAQLSPRCAGFHIVDVCTADAPWAGSLERLAAALPHRTKVVSKRGLAQTIRSVSDELERRLNSEHAASEDIFLFLVGLHRMRDIREDEGGLSHAGADPSDLRESLAKILREGPDLGVHTIAWGDSPPSVGRVFDRRMLEDLGQRILGPMSEQDSMGLIEETSAGHLDRPHRLIRFDEDRPGDLEIFRPYAVSDSTWLDLAAARLAVRPQQ